MTDRTILLVDNDPTGVDRLAQQLSPFGYGVRHCPAIYDLGARIAEMKPSVLLIQLDKDPAVDKHMTIEAISLVLGSEFSETPTIFLADDYDLKTRLESIRAGAKAFLVRPFSPLDLVDALDLLTEPQAEKPFRVLIVDEDERNAEFYSTALNHAGKRSIALNKPMNVLDALDFRPELVLMDQYMSEIEGRELGAVIGRKPPSCLFRLCFCPPKATQTNS